MELLTTIFESFMLVCFGCSWPINAMKHYRAGTARGMSLQFIILILVGYVAGITAKIIKGFGTWHSWFVLAVYILNFVMVSLDLIVYFRNRALDKKNGVK